VICDLRLPNEEEHLFDIVRVVLWIDDLKTNNGQSESELNTRLDAKRG